MKRNGKQAVMILPGHHKHSRITLLCTLGYIFRCVLAFVCAFGFASFIFNSVDADLPQALILITCLAACTLLAIMERGDKLFLIGSAVFIAMLVYTVSICGGIKNAFMGAALAFINTCLRRLGSLGFVDAESQITSLRSVTDGLDMSEYEMLCIAAIFCCVLICMMFVLLIANKAHILPIAITCLIILAFIFFFGMGDDTFSLSLTIAAFCGCAALARYDAVFVKKKAVRSALGTAGHSRAADREVNDALGTNSALGGFYGLFAALIAFLLIIGPMRISESMDDIPTVSKPLKKLEERIVTLLTGTASYEAGIESADKYAGKPRSTSMSARTYTGKIHTVIGSDTAIPIYLRSWIGTSYKNDSWSIVGSDEIKEYRQTFGHGFSPELLTAELLTAVDPSLTEPGSKSASELGYTVSRVHIDTDISAGSTLSLPSYTDPRNRLSKYGSDKPLTSGYSNYYEGIFAANSDKAPKRYSVVATLQKAPDENSVSGIEELISHFSEQRNIITVLRRMIDEGADEQLLKDKYEQLASTVISSGSWDTFTEPSKEASLAYRYVYTMTLDERSRVNALIDNLPLYNGYVKRNYLSLCEGSEQITELMQEIIAAERLDKVGGSYTYLDTHRAVKAVISYLALNTRYTLSPDIPSQDGYKNAALSFLFDTQEGYCVQYATAAAMLLRSIGIPTRYAEGYIATSFSRSADGASTGYYRSEIPDRNAHAWIEVYFDGFGWITYEVTTPYINLGTTIFPGTVGDNTEITTAPKPEVTAPTPDGTGIPEKPETAPTQLNKPDKPEVTTSPSDKPKPTGTVPPQSAPTSKSDKDTNGVSAAVTVVTIATALTACLLIAVLIIRLRAAANERKRRELIKTACTDGIRREEALICIADMGDRIMALLAHLKLSPKLGELAVDFARRADKELKDKLSLSFGDILPALQKGEFSNEVSLAELRAVADYYNELFEFSTKKNGRINAIYVKYFLKHP